MIRKFMGAVTLVALMAMAARPAAAQTGFTETSTDIGPTIGIGGIGNASIAIGGRFEKGIKTLPSLNNGVLGIQAGFDYYSWSNSFFSYTYIPVGVTANYHFVLEDKRLDPFVGLGLGFSIVSCDWEGSGIDLCDSSYIYLIAKGGIRYYVSEKMAIYGDVGAGAAVLNVGLMFKLK